MPFDLFNVSKSCLQGLQANMEDHLKMHLDHSQRTDEAVLQIYPSSIRRRVLRHLYHNKLARNYLFKDVQHKFIDILLSVSKIETFMPRVRGDTGNVRRDLWAKGDILVSVLVDTYVILYWPQDEMLAEGDYAHELNMVIEGSARLISRIGLLDKSTSAMSSASFTVARTSESTSIHPESYLGRISMDEFDPSRSSWDASSSRGALAGQSWSVYPGEVFGEVSFFTETAQTEVSAHP